VEIVLVATKLDQLPGSERKLALQQLKQQTSKSWIGFSIELPETHDLLWSQIMKRLELDQPAAAAPEAPAIAAPESPVESQADSSP
jgi:hypothetical protein